VGKGRQGQPENYCLLFLLFALIVDEWHDLLCSKSLVLFLRQEHQLTFRVKKGSCRFSWLCWLWIQLNYRHFDGADV
jgi:hypothetical protein